MMRIDWIFPKRFAVGGTPTDANDLRNLATQSIRTIITLTELPLTRFPDITPELVESLNLRLIHYGFPDQTAPTLDQVNAIINDIVQAIRIHSSVYLHCFGGSGRTGTILHIFLLQAGYSWNQTRTIIKHKRSSCLRLSDEQQQFVQMIRIK